MCGVEKPAECFNKMAAAWDGLQGRCRECAGVSRKKWGEDNHEHREEWRRDYYEENRDELLAKAHDRYLENPEKIKAAVRAWLADHPGYQRDYYVANRDELLARAKERYAENPERNKATNALWRLGHKAEIAAWAKKDYALNPEKYAAKRHRRRARMTGTPGTHTAEDITAQYERQRGKCYYHIIGASDNLCAKTLKGGYHTDHVIPIAGSRTSSDGPENLVLACPHCNLRKHNTDPMTFAGIMF